MNELERQIVSRIANEGPLTFAEFMRSALYDAEHGYYMSGSEKTGWEGDFITSPELDPAFGLLWGNAFHELWSGAGQPDRFAVIELGPGEGGFARSLLENAPQDLQEVLDLVLVEIDPGRRARQEKLLAGEPVSWATSVRELDPVPLGVVFANEVLDNQPVHVLRNRAGGFQELHVDTSDEGLAEVWLDCTDEDLVQRFLSSDVPAGIEIEISLEAEDLALASLNVLGAGAAIFIDYGRNPGEEVRSTLASYSSRGASRASLTEPGSKDVTAHVDWSAITQACLQNADVEVLGPLSQRVVLAALGAHDLDDELRSLYGSLIAAGKGVEAVATLSRRQALGALMDPGGLGGLGVLVALRGIERPAWARKKDRPEGRSVSQ